MKSSGYTLVEVLVTLGVLVFLSVIFIGYNRSNEAQLALFKDQAQVISVLNQAKALTLEKRIDLLNPSLGEICGFGVKTKVNFQNDYYIFANYSNNNNCPGSSEEIINSFSLDNRLVFSSSTNILFLSPYLYTSSFSDQIIEIKNPQNNQIIKIKVNSVGLITLTN